MSAAAPQRALLTSEGNLPSFDGATGWLNSEPLSPPSLQRHHKVVLVQFWTYTCINWLRTLPYVRAWAQKYQQQGLVAIGVHTPEFSFEHHLDNVRQAAQAMRVTYPIAVDSDYAVWDAFGNRYWPALYVADANGRIRYHHFGEGAYDESERVIQKLLAEAGASDLDAELVTVDARGAEVAASWDDLESQETYLGLSRTASFASPGGFVRGRPAAYQAPASLEPGQWALSGNWTFNDEPVTLNEPGGRIVCQFHARDLNLVIGPTLSATSIPFQVLLDGRPPGAAHGFDVDEQGHGTLSQPRLHQLIRQPQPITDRRFDIEFLAPALASYVFTFG
jgi:thiol-disulfide isomerase/thioredoxin